MNKLITGFILFMLVMVVSCQQVARPIYDDQWTSGNEGEAPPEITINNNELDIIDHINNSNNGDLDTGYTKVTDRTLFKDGYLITILDKKWYVLGVKDVGVNMNYGGSNTIETKLQDAIDMAGNNNNWDPRKLFFTQDGSVKIAWTGKVLKIVGQTVTSYDKNPAALYGKVGASYLSPAAYGKYPYTSVLGTDINAKMYVDESAAFGRGDLSGLHFLTEAHSLSLGYRIKGWAYDASATYKDEDKDGKEYTRVYYENKHTRFGYIQSGKIVPTKDNYPAGTNKPGSNPPGNNLSFKDDVKGNTGSYDVRNSKGKVVFVRGNDDNNTFLISLTGDNVRTKNSTLNFTEYSRVLDVAIDFDTSFYNDTKADGYTDVRDLPQKNNSGGIQKIYFLYLAK